MSHSVAKDRSWFCQDYRPISSFISGFLDEYTTPVVGIGTVRLSVKVSPSTEDREHSIMTLHNVLHVPGMTCNLVGAPIHEYYNVHIDRDNKAGTIALCNGAAVGFFQDVGVCRQLRLSGPPVGPRVGPVPFKSNASPFIRAKWPLAERKKWLPSSLAASDTRPAPDRPSAQERVWLKKHYGNEYKFLAAHCLKIRSEEDRQEGLQIMRAMMQHDTADTVGGLGHRSERLTSAERQWLKKHYENEYKFLILHGLSIYKEEDRQEGLRAMRAMMAKDELHALEKRPQMPRQQEPAVPPSSTLVPSLSASSTQYQVNPSRIEAMRMTSNVNTVESAPKHSTNRRMYMTSAMAAMMFF